MLGTNDPVLRYRGYVAVLVGLVLVILARGCDSIGNRNVARRQAQVKLATADFNQKWDAKDRDISRKIDALRASEKPDPELMNKYVEQQTKLATQRAEERHRLEQDDWQDLRFDADNAAARNVTNAYWREWFFLFGAVILAVGLVVMSLTSPGPERWIAMVMLAIIVFSIFVIGSPWLTSISNALR
jgi:hypothetical protein